MPLFNNPKENFVETGDESKLYSEEISLLKSYFNSMTPINDSLLESFIESVKTARDTSPFLDGDVLNLNTPQINDGVFIFKPIEDIVYMNSMKLNDSTPQTNLLNEYDNIITNITFYKDIFYVIVFNNSNYYLEEPVVNSVINGTKVSLDSISTKQGIEPVKKLLNNDYISVEKSTSGQFIDRHACVLLFDNDKNISSRLSLLVGEERIDIGIFIRSDLLDTQDSFDSIGSYTLDFKSNSNALSYENINISFNKQLFNGKLMVVVDYSHAIDSSTLSLTYSTNNVSIHGVNDIILNSFTYDLKLLVVSLSKNEFLFKDVRTRVNDYNATNIGNITERRMLSHSGFVYNDLIFEDNEALYIMVEDNGNRYMVEHYELGFLNIDIKAFEIIIPIDTPIGDVPNITTRFRDANGWSIPTVNNTQYDYSSITGISGTNWDSFQKLYDKYFNYLLTPMNNGTFSNKRLKTSLSYLDTKVTVANNTNVSDLTSGQENELVNLGFLHNNFYNTNDNYVGDGLESNLLPNVELEYESSLKGNIFTEVNVDSTINNDGIYVDRVRNIVSDGIDGYQEFSDHAKFYKVNDGEKTLIYPLTEVLDDTTVSLLSPTITMNYDGISSQVTSSIPVTVNTSHDDVSGVIINDFVMRENTSDGDRNYNVKKTMFDDNNATVYLDKSLPVNRIYSTIGKGSNTMFLVNGTIFNGDGTISHDVYRTIRPLNEYDINHMGGYITNDGEMFAYSSNAIDGIPISLGIINSFNPSNFPLDDLIDMFYTSKGIYCIWNNSGDIYMSYLGGTTGLKRLSSTPDNTNVFIDFSYGNDIPHPLELTNGDLIVYKIDGMVFKLYKYDIVQSNIVEYISEDLNLNSSIKPFNIFMVGDVLHFQNYESSTSHYNNLTNRNMFKRFKINYDLTHTVIENLVLPINHEEPIPNYKVINTKDTWVCFSNHNSSLLIGGKISKYLVNNPMNQELKEITFFKNRGYKIVDVWFDGSILLAITDDGSTWYLTNRNDYNLPLTNSSDLDYGWLKIRLIFNAISFLKDTNNINNSSIIIETVSGGQHLVNGSINVTTNNLPIFINSKTAQPINFGTSNIPLVKRILSKIR